LASCDKASDAAQVVINRIVKRHLAQWQPVISAVFLELIPIKTST